MARRKDGNRYWIYGEDAAPAAQFTAFLSKVLKNRRANYIRQKSAEQEKETSFDELEETAAQQDGGSSVMRPERGCGCRGDFQRAAYCAYGTV